MTHPKVHSHRWLKRLPITVGVWLATKHRAGLGEYQHIDHSQQPADTALAYEEICNILKMSLGSIKKFKAHLCLKVGARPSFWHPWKVVFALNEVVAQELEYLVQKGTLRPVEHSEWTANIMALIKQDASLRICGDYKVTITRSWKNISILSSPQWGICLSIWWPAVHDATISYMLFNAQNPPSYIWSEWFNRMPAIGKSLLTWPWLIQSYG